MMSFKFAENIRDNDLTMSAKKLEDLLCAPGFDSLRHLIFVDDRSVKQAGYTTEELAEHVTSMIKCPPTTNLIEASVTDDQSGLEIAADDNKFHFETFDFVTEILENMGVDRPKIYWSKRFQIKGGPIDFAVMEVRWQSQIKCPICLEDNSLKKIAKTKSTLPKCFMRPGHKTSHYMIKKLSTDGEVIDSISFSGLQLHLLKAHGFYGNEINFSRIPPARWIDFFHLGGNAREVILLQ